MKPEDTSSQSTKMSASNPNQPRTAPLSRRDALKWLAGTSAAGMAAPALAAPNETEPAPAAWMARNTLHDPDYVKNPYPWEKTMSPEELKTAGALADIILPKDDLGPAATEVGVPEFLNEWISAPYEDKQEDAQIIRGGLAWLNTESFRRHEHTFVDLTAAQQTAIVDDICVPENAKPELRTGVTFFKRFRTLCLGGYYTHSATWKHLGYVGNVGIGGPYPGVPDEIIKLLGLEDVV